MTQSDIKLNTSSARLVLLVVCFPSLLFFIESCNIVQEKQLHESLPSYTFGDSVTLNKTGTLELEIDSLTNIQTQYLQYFSTKDSVEYLLWENASQLEIHFYNLNTLSLDRKMVFEKEGPSGIKKLHGFFVKDIDSIFVFNSPFFDIFLFD